jgi:hypothetical protein
MIDYNNYANFPPFPPLEKVEPKMESKKKIMNLLKNFGSTFSKGG